MRTTRSNQGTGDTKDQKMSKRPMERSSAARPTTGADRRSSTARPSAARPTNDRPTAARPVAERSSTVADRRSSPTAARSGRPRTDTERAFAGKPERTTAGKPGERSRTGSSRSVTGKPPTAVGKPAYQSSAKPVRQVEGPKEMDFLSGRNPVMEALRHPEEGAVCRCPHADEKAASGGRGFGREWCRHSAGLMQLKV